MFLRCTRRVKDGKAHEYWSVVENRRLADGRVAQRQVLYLGEINASQREAWRKTIEVQDEGTRRQVALFPAGSMPADDVDAIGVRLIELRLERAAPMGRVLAGVELWQQLELDGFWRARLPPSREGTPWVKVLKTLVAYRLIDPGSEWRLHRQWFDASAMADLLEADFALAEKNTLYRCLDRLVEHKDELFRFLVRRWGELFGAKFDVLLYDLTSTYFESDVERSRRPAPVRLQPRQARRLPPGGHRADRHARGLPAELRGAGGQHGRLDDAERVPRSHRAALRARQPHLGDGPRHPHRGQPGQDARHGRVLPGGHAQGAAQQARAGLPRPALGAGARRRGGQAAGRRGGRVRAGAK